MEALKVCAGEWGECDKLAGICGWNRGWWRYRERPRVRIQFDGSQEFQRIVP